MCNAVGSRISKATYRLSTFPILLNAFIQSILAKLTRPLPLCNMDIPLRQLPLFVTHMFKDLRFKFLRNSYEVWIHSPISNVPLWYHQQAAFPLVHSFHSLHTEQVNADNRTSSRVDAHLKWTDQLVQDHATSLVQISFIRKASNNVVS
jgi:hypothetical protein